jgi:hypothetical protein
LLKQIFTLQPVCNVGPLPRLQSSSPLYIRIGCLSLSPTPVLLPVSAYSCSPTKNHSPRKGILHKWVQTRKRHTKPSLSLKMTLYFHVMFPDSVRSILTNYLDLGAEAKETQTCA